MLLNAQMLFETDAISLHIMKQIPGISSPEAVGTSCSQFGNSKPEDYLNSSIESAQSSGLTLLGSAVQERNFKPAILDRIARNILEQVSADTYSEKK